jgi:branched-chain amino acid aminotransferase
LSQLQLFAITENGPQSLPIPADASTQDELYQGLPLGVYTALRTFEKHKFLYLEDHLTRLGHSMRLLGWNYQLDEMRMRRAIHSVCSAAPWPEMRVRLDVLAEPTCYAGIEYREMIGLMRFNPLPAALYANGVTADFAEGLVRGQPLVKTAAFVEARKAYSGGSSTAYERLMLDNEGRILEGFSSNFYAVHNRVLRTAGAGVLEGITRKIILDLAAELGIPLRLEAIHVSEIPELEEAAISSSSRGLLPVVNIAGQPIGDGRPGPLCSQLHTAYDAFVERTVRSAT